MIILVVDIAGVGAIELERPPPAPLSLTQLSIVLPSDQQLNSVPPVPHVALSPDGRGVVYASTNGRLYLRPLDRPEPDADDSGAWGYLFK